MDYRDNKFQRYFLLIAFGITFTAFLAVMSVKAVAGINSSDKNPPTENVVQNTTQESTTPEATTEEVTTEAVTETEEETTQKPTNPPTKEPPKVSSGADTSYFDDAVFIGDSRTVLLQMYADWNADIFAETGLTIWDVFDKKVHTRDNQKATIKDLLGRKQYKKVYIQLGINELGTGTAKTFCDEYERVLNEIKRLQPNAIIYVQSIMHVSQAQDNKNTYINNKSVNERNQAIRELADNKTVFWLDENQVFDDSNGKLASEYTSDGVHIKASCVPIWEKFLLDNAVKR